MRLVTFTLNWEEISASLKSNLLEVQRTIEKLLINRDKLSQLSGQADELVNVPLDSAIGKIVDAEKKIKQSISHLDAMLKKISRYGW